VYRELIGSLMYLVNTRPDICFAVNTLSQCMIGPQRIHWIASKHVLRDLKGTMHYSIIVFFILIRQEMQVLGRTLMVFVSVWV
jgi:hypothetical protein